MHPITVLLEQTAAMAALRAGLSAYRRLGVKSSVISLRADNFRLVNDTLGHSSGDTMIKEIVRRIDDLLDSRGEAFHCGGEEFLLVLPACDLDEASDLALAIIALLREPISLDGVELALRTSAGIAATDHDNHTVALLLQAADLALWRSTDVSGNSVEVFRPGLRTAAWHTRQAAEAVSAAASGRHFSFHYQPIVDLFRGDVVAVEALMRWDARPDALGNPARFIPILDSLGDLTTVTQYLVPDALTQLSRWRSQMPELALAVNFNSSALERADVADWLAHLPAICGLPAAALIIEVSESAMASPQAVAHLGQLHDQGLTIWLDDFGTGWSSLSALRDLPLQAVKLAREFLFPDTTGVDEAMLEAIVALARTVGLDVIAEGIETSAQQAHLTRHSVHLGQGFHIARPMPAPRVGPWLTATHVRPNPMA